MSWDLIVEQLKITNSLLDRINLRAEQTNRRLDTLIEQGKSADIGKIAHELYLLQEAQWASKQFIDCPNGEEQGERIH